MTLRVVSLFIFMNLPYKNPFWWLMILVLSVLCRLLWYSIVWLSYWHFLRKNQPFILDIRCPDHPDQHNLSDIEDYIWKMVTPHRAIIFPYQMVRYMARKAGYSLQSPVRGLMAFHSIFNCSVLKPDVPYSSVKIKSRSKIPFASRFV